MSVRQNLSRKLIAAHLVEGRMELGEEIGLRVDQTLTQDATGTMAYLQFEAMGVPRVKTNLSVSYVDHNMLQADSKNADDHNYLQDTAARYGLYFSRPGNGICHQVHLERFSVPGETLVGSDSHSPTCGGVGMLAFGAGGLEVATSMGGLPYYIRMPKIVGVELVGTLREWASAKDVILELLRRLSVSGGRGRILEYHGAGVAGLEVPERATITYMGAEMGATTSIFPSDARTRAFLQAQGRGQTWRPLASDRGAEYDELVVIDLDALEPLIARPDSPDNVVPLTELIGTPVDQVAIGSCTNSSYQDLLTVARLLDGKIAHPRLSLVISPGSRQVYEMIARGGALATLLSAGARMLEAACGPCPGIGAVPASNAVSLRSFNRNFPGRCGSMDARVYLASPAVCAAAAVAGEIVDPRQIADAVKIRAPRHFPIDDRMIEPPAADPDSVEIRRGPNIKPIVTRGALPDRLHGEVLLKLGDNVSTDKILPAMAHILPLRSNLPAISEYTFSTTDPTFVARAKAANGGVLVASRNYGQGSSREHAALAPMFLGVSAVLAISFARIHQSNLVNFGIVPLVFADEADYARFEQGDVIEVTDVRESVSSGQESVTVLNLTRGVRAIARLELGTRARRTLLAGGLLNAVRAASGAKREPTAVPA